MGVGRQLKSEDGAAAVEFAIVMVLLFTILFAIVQFGIAFSKLNVFTGAAREGARFVAVRCYDPTNPNPPASGNTWCVQGSGGNIANRVASAAVGYNIGPGPPTATIGGTQAVCTDNTIGQAVTVSWSQNITINIPFVPGLNPITYTDTVQGVFRCE